MDKQEELELKENTRAILEEVASRKAPRKCTITYKELWEGQGREFVYPDPEGDAILGALAREDYQAGKGMLSVVVINDSINQPGGGFFKLARDIGALTDDMDDYDFFILQIKKVHKVHGEKNKKE